MTFGEQFLSCPDEFPHSFQEEPWGNECLEIDFVGGPYLVSGLNAVQAGQLRNHFEDSCTDGSAGGHDGVRIRLCKAHPSAFKEIVLTSWELTFDLDYHDEFLHVAGLHAAARITLKPGPGATIWTSRNGEPDFPANIFENIFRIIVTNRLHDSGGMLIHSACVIDDGCAVLFPGRSGDGKSTLSRLSLDTGRMVLSDDMNALTWNNGRPMVEKVPFAGDLGRTWARSSQYRLKAVFGISKTEDTTVCAMPLAKTVALMVASAPYLNTSRQRLPDLLAHIHRFAGAVPAGLLGFRPDQDCWPAIRKFLTMQEKS